MRVYVAASSQECDRAQSMMDALRAAGHVVTHDWLPSVASRIADGVAECDMDDDEAREIAQTDLDAVEASDALVYLAPNTATRMGWMEFDRALSRGIHTIVANSSPKLARQSIATRLADCITTDSGVLAALAEIARER